MKKNPRKKVESSSKHSSFVANVTASSLTHDRLVRLEYYSTSKNSLSTGYNFVSVRDNNPTL